MTQTIHDEAEVELPPQRRFLGPDRNWHLAFGGLLAIALVTFTLWSFGYVSSGAEAWTSAASPHGLCSG